MSVGKQSSSAITITYNSQAIQNGVMTISGVKVTAPTQLTTAFGDSWEESTPTGMRKVDPITLTGWFDDTPTTGTHAVLQIGASDVDPNGAAPTLVVVFGPNSGDTFTGAARRASYEVLGKNGNLTEFAAVLQPTGSFAWS